MARPRPGRWWRLRCAWPRWRTRRCAHCGSRGCLEAPSPPPLASPPLHSRQARSVSCGGRFVCVAVATHWIRDDETTKCMMGDCGSVFTMINRRVRGTAWEGGGPSSAAHRPRAPLPQFFPIASITAATAAASSGPSEAPDCPVRRLTHLPPTPPPAASAPPSASRCSTWGTLSPFACARSATKSWWARRSACERTRQRVC